MPTTDYEQHIAQLEAAQQCAELISHINGALSKATNEQEILSALTGLVVQNGVTMSTLAYARLDADGQVTGVDLVAIQDGNGQPLPLEIFPNTSVALDEPPVLRLALENPDEPLFIENVFTDPRTATGSTLEISRQMNVAASIVLWFIAGGQAQGVLTLFWDKEHTIGPELRSVCKAIQPVAGAVVSNRRLLLNLEQTVEERTAALQENEVALRQSQQMLQMVLDTIPMRVFWKDKDLRYLGCNQLFAMDAGLKSPQEIIGKDDYELSWAEVADLYRADDRTVIESGEARLNFEEPQNREDGTQSWLRTSKTPLWNDASNIFGVLGMYEDITTRKQADEALRQSEEYYRALFTNSSEIYAILEPDGALRYQSPSFERTFGYPVAETIGRSPLEYIHPDDAAGVAQAITEIAQQPGSTQTIVYRWKHRDGSWRTLESVGANLIGNPAVRGIVASSRDITERKQAEEALNQANLVIENSTVVLFRWKAAEGWPVELVSSNVERMFGYKAEDLLSGKVPYPSIVHPDDLARIAAEVEAHASGGEDNFEQEYRIVGCDGSVHWTYDRTVIERDPHGVITHFQGIVMDITDQKRAETERDRLHQQVVDAQREALAELSTPIIPIMDRIIVMPLIGGIDSVRARDIMRSLLEGITRYQAKIAILDITGVPMVDSGVADHLNRTMQAARLKGAQTIITGVSDAVAETIVDLGIDWTNFETLRDLQTGLITALERVGFQLTQRANSGKKSG